MKRVNVFPQKRQLGIHDHPGNGMDGGVQRGKRTRAAGNDATRVCEKRYGRAEIANDAIPALPTAPAATND